MSKGTPHRKGKERKDGVETKRQVQHMSIMLRWLWRSNEKPT